MQVYGHYLCENPCWKIFSKWAKDLFICGTEAIMMRFPTPPLVLGLEPLTSCLLGQISNHCYYY